MSQMDHHTEPGPRRPWTLPGLALDEYANRDQELTRFARRRATVDYECPLSFRQDMACIRSVILMVAKLE